jgi:hypothetical protein
MLKQYEKLPSGVVKQKRIRQSGSSLVDYKKAYNDLGQIVENMSYLRLGYILGVINKPGSLLDVGYGNASFLRVASSVITRCYGYDINDYPVPDNVQRINNMKNSYYDVITFFDSLEHFTNIDFVGDLRCSFIVVSVPECHYPENTEWFIGWKHRRPDEHIFHFSRKALLRFMASHGYTCVGIGNVEDSIRGNLNGETNILTGVFKKINVQV